MKQEDIVSALLQALGTLRVLTVANSILLVQKGVTVREYEDALMASKKQNENYISEIRAKMNGQTPPPRSEKAIWEDLEIGDLWTKSTDQDEGGATHEPNQ